MAVRDGNSVGGGSVVEITPAGVQTTIASGTTRPFAITVDGNDNVFYIEEYNTHNVYEIPYTGSAYGSRVLITTNADLGLAQTRRAIFGWAWAQTADNWSSSQPRRSNRFDDSGRWHPGFVPARYDGRRREHLLFGWR